MGHLVGEMAMTRGLNVSSFCFMAQILIAAVVAAIRGCLVVVFLVMPSEGIKVALG